MAKSKNKKPGIILKSTESRHETYITKKNAKNTPDRLELRKYDPILRKHVIYKEKKKK